MIAKTKTIDDVMTVADLEDGQIAEPYRYLRYETYPVWKSVPREAVRHVVRRGSKLLAVTANGERCIADDDGDPSWVIRAMPVVS